MCYSIHLLILAIWVIIHIILLYAPFNQYITYRQVPIHNLGKLRLPNTSNYIAHFLKSRIASCQQKSHQFSSFPSLSFSEFLPPYFHYYFFSLAPNLIRMHSLASLNRQKKGCIKVTLMQNLLIELLCMIQNLRHLNNSSLKILKV